MTKFAYLSGVFFSSDLVAHTDDKPLILSVVDPNLECDILLGEYLLRTFLLFGFFSVLFVLFCLLSLSLLLLFLLLRSCSSTSLAPCACLPNSPMVYSIYSSGTPSYFRKAKQEHPSIPYQKLFFIKAEIID